jgi:hypothetical protein
VRVALQLESYAKQIRWGELSIKGAEKLVQELYEAAYKEGYNDAKQDCVDEDE